MNNQTFYNALGNRPGTFGPNLWGSASFNNDSTQPATNVPVNASTQKAEATRAQTGCGCADGSNKCSCSKKRKRKLAVFAGGMAVGLLLTYLLTKKS